MLKKISLMLAVFSLCNHFSVFLYVPKADLLPDVIQYSKDDEVATRGSVLPLQYIEERDGFACINGNNAFDQKVIQASYARPVVVFFFAQRDSMSQAVWSRLCPLAKIQEEEKLVDFVAVDIFQNIEGEENQNYQIAMKCMSTIGLDSVQLPVVVFFKNGSMCVSPQTILTGEIETVKLQQIAALLGKKNS